MKASVGQKRPDILLETDLRLFSLRGGCAYVIHVAAGTGTALGPFVERCGGLAATRDGRLFGKDLFRGFLELDPWTGAILNDYPGFYGGYQALSAHPLTSEKTAKSKTAGRHRYKLGTESI